MNHVATDHLVGLASLSPTNAAAPYADLAALRAAIRGALHQAGFKGSNENPFKTIIAPGQAVLLKPNWVLHYNKGNHGMDCMITHPAFIEAVIQEVAEARPASIIIADAPIQSAEFNLIVTPAIAQRFQAAAGAIPVFIRDLRTTICSPGAFSLSTAPNEERTESAILFDLGSDSLLEPITRTASEAFRITSYDHRALVRTHTAGTHQYMLVPEIFDCDVIINLPKLKSHRKSGITAALKNMVGVNGNKNYLPHHRVGGSAQGGDCYQGRHPLKRLAEYCLDHANMNIDRLWYMPWSVASSIFMKLNYFMTHDSELDGGWYGNDTVWRMVLDLNRLVLYGTKDGLMHDTPQRTVYTITDAIIIGEGLGPLAPEPKTLGLVTCSASSVCADLIHAALMHFDWKKIPLIAQAFTTFRYPLVPFSPDTVRMHYRGGEYTPLETAQHHGAACKPAKGWKGHIEQGT